MTHTFLAAEWRKIIMAQYAIDPTVLLPWLPSGLELDLYRDTCFVSLVGFLFDRTRIKGVPIPFHTCFEEVNLRFYVTRMMSDGTRRRGVVFIREFVPRPAITLIARSLYGEPYQTLPMRHRIEAAPDLLSVEYAWRSHGRWSRLAVEASPHAGPIAQGSLEEFITEHYWGYTRRTRGATSEYSVEHPRWPVYPILNFAIEGDLGELYGPQFASLKAAKPDSLLMAEGSGVSVSSGTRIVS